VDRSVAGPVSHLRNAACLQVSASAHMTDEDLRRRNVRTALWLAATAVAVFIMFLFRYALSGP
jgi:hypothetical protein